MAVVSLRVAQPDDRPVLERLWLMFRHDLSEFRGLLHSPDGTFRSERLQAALDGDPDWLVYLLRYDERPVGLALVRGLAGPIRVLSGFFVVRGARAQRDRPPRGQGAGRPASRPLGGRVSGREQRGGALLAPSGGRRSRGRVD